MNKEKNRNRIWGLLFMMFIVCTGVLTFISRSFYKHNLPVVTVIISGQDEKDYKTSNGKMIPVSALKQDAKGYYVLILRQNDSVLGNGYKAERRSVDLIESNKENCVILGIPGDESVIVDATCEISVGDDIYYDDEKLND